MTSLPSKTHEEKSKEHRENHSTLDQEAMGMETFDVETISFAGERPTTAHLRTEPPERDARPTHEREKQEKKFFHASRSCVKLAGRNLEVDRTSSEDISRVSLFECVVNRVKAVLVRVRV
jgi:hypothetical protein